MSDRRESDRLLELAERQFERVANRTEIALASRLRTSVAALGALVNLVGVFVNAHAPSTAFFWVFCVSCLGFTFAAMSFAFTLRDDLRCLRVEESVLKEALSLVQESEHSLADKEQWTLLERAEFRLRLRRLPVGVAPPPAASAISSPTPTPTTTRPPSTA